MKIRAPAKINLFLEVTGTRPDGFHTIETIFQTIRLADRITLRKAARGIHIAVSGPFKTGVPADERNIIYRAAQRVLSHLNIDQGLSITVQKNIPHGAGLGGGSSDAAAIIKAIPRLFGKRLSRRSAVSIASSCGADVPFFLYGGCACGTGIGNHIHPVPSVSRYWIVLVYPHISCSTAEIYRCLKRKKPLTNNENIHSIIKHLKSSAPLQTWGILLFNRLENAAFSLFPALKKTFIAMKNARVDGNGKTPVRMSGSGSCLYALFATRHNAQEFQRKFRFLYTGSHITTWILRPF
jgi:4-diphosphocytidyl-2-C-methyl-D-erythritol kinase